ncbi:hypothetical protein FXO37_30458 [Capsicum annuum]|nr:hypothetical protein FXO37_30458 [Capsicum annuum]
MALQIKKKIENARSEEAALKIEVLELAPKNWNRLCDIWLDPDYKKRCQVNKINRSKLKCNHIMASKAFVVARAEISEEHKGMELDKIDFYKSTHYSTEKGWSSKQAEANYNSMNDLKALYTSGESSITIDEIVDVVLDKKLGYIKSLGYGLKLLEQHKEEQQS